MKTSSKSAVKKSSKKKAANQMTQAERQAEWKEHLRRRALERNPLADILNSEAYGLFEYFEEFLKALDPSICAENIGSEGSVFNDDTSEMIRTTNEQCAKFQATVLLTAQFDHRKNIVRQMGNWLKKQSAIFAEAAEKFLEIKDCRHLPMIKRLISETGLADEMAINDLCVSLDGKRIVPRSELVAAE